MSDETSPPHEELPPEEPRASPLPYQREVAAELQRLDPQLAGMYEHAAKLLPRIHEPGMATFVAQAGREISRGVVRQLCSENAEPLSDEELERYEKERNRVPIAQILQLDPEDPRVDLWFKLVNDFSSWMKYRYPGPSPEQIRGAFEILSSLLFGRIGPYFATEAELDALLAISEPTDSDVQRLQHYLLRPAQRNHFFGSLEHAGWLEPLARHGVFAKPPEERPWPEGGYLVRIATVAPDIVADIIRSIPPTVQNPGVWRAVLQAAANLPPDQAVRVVKVVARALSKPGTEWSGDDAIRLTTALANDGKTKAAFQLASYLLFVPQADADEGEEQPARRYRTTWMLPRLVWHLDDFLNDALPALERQDPLLTLKLLLKTIRKLQVLLAEIGESRWGSWSAFFRSATNRDDIPSSTTNAAVEVAQRSAGSAPKSAHAVMDLIDSFEGEVFTRIGYLVLAAAGEHLQDRLDSVVSSKATIEPEGPAREIAALLRAQFSNASPSARRLFRYALLRGPNVDDVRATLEFWGNSEPTDDDIEDQKQRWQRKRLTWFRGEIPDELRDIAERLGAYGVVPDVRDQELAEVDFYSSGVWAGESTPATANDLSSRSPRDVFALLRDWDPKAHKGGGTTRGLELSLSDYAKGNPEQAVVVAELTIREGLPLGFVRSLLEGLSHAAQGKVALPWEDVVRFAACAVQQASKPPSPYPAEKEPRRWVVSAAVELVREGTSNDLLPTGLQEEVWGLLRAAVECPYIWEDGNERPIETFEGVLTVALNHPAGDVTHALIAVGLWAYRLRLPDGVEPTEALSAEVRTVAPQLAPLLERVLQQTGRPSIAAQAMIGQYLPHLHLLLPEWVEEKASNLLVGGAENPLNRPVWGAYVTRARLYDSVFRVLRPWYVEAAKAAEAVGRSAEPEDHWSLTRHLAEHVTVAAIRGQATLEDADQLLELVFKNVPASELAQVYWEIFHGWSDAKESPPLLFIERLLRFWEWRLAELAKEPDSPATMKEAKGLGWFIRTPYLPDTEVIGLGLETARLARGDLQLHTDWERFRLLSTVDVDQTFEIIELALQAQLREPLPYIAVEEVMPLLRLVLARGKRETKDRAEALVHRLGESGFRQFRELLSED